MLAQVDHLPDCLIPYVVDARWWLCNAIYRDQSITACGVPLPTIIEHLRVVYDEATCEQMISDGFWAPLLGLFSGNPWIEWVGTMLSLGLDLRVLGFERYRRYLKALRKGDQWDGARLEISVEANLLRIGLQPHRPTFRKNAKQWDLSVEFKNQAYAIECKALSNGKLDGNFEHLVQRFENMGIEYQRDAPLDALLCFSPWMLRAMNEYRVQLFYECVLPEFTEELTRTITSSRPERVPRRVGRFGQISIQPSNRDDGFLGRWETCGYVPTPIQRLRRLMTILGEATDNFDNEATSARRIAAVWMGKQYLSPEGAARFLNENVGRTFKARRTQLAIDQRRLGFHHGMLLGDRSGFDFTGWRTDLGEINLGKGVLPPVLGSALSSWRWHVQLDQ